MDVLFPKGLLPEPIQTLDDVARQYAVPGHPFILFKVGKVLFDPTLEYKVLIGRSFESVFRSLDSSVLPARYSDPAVFLKLLSEEYVSRGLVDVYDAQRLLAASDIDAVADSRIQTSRLARACGSSSDIGDVLVVPSAASIMNLFGKAYKIADLIGGRKLYEPPGPPSPVSMRLAA